MDSTSTELESLQIRADLIDELTKSLQDTLAQIKHVSAEFSIENTLEKNSNRKNTKHKRKPRAIDALGARMKEYEEKAYVTKIMDPKLPMIVRLDGHCFHTFTKGFDRPFDKNLHRAMVLTTSDLVERYHACTGYTQSDEITLIWSAVRLDSEEKKEEKRQKKKNENKVHIFGGRGVKISSVLAGYCSSRFNYHLMKMYNDKAFSNNNDNEHIYKKHVIDRIISGEAHFDGRVFNVPSNIEVLNNLLWRCHFDCTRNSVSALARTYFSAKQVHGKSSDDKIKMLKTEKNVDWEKDTPLAFRYGTFIKKQIYNVQYTNPRNNKKGITQRTKISFTPIALDKFDEKYMEMLLDKYWTEKWLVEYKDTFESVS